MPGADLPAGFADHPEVEGNDQAGLLGSGNEVHRRDEAAFGVLPAHQGLEPRNPAVVEGDDRLIGDPELVAFNRAPEVCLQLQAVDDGRVHRLIEDDVMGLPLGLGAVHRGVGVAKKFDRPIVPGIAGGDPDA